MTFSELSMLYRTEYSLTSTSWLALFCNVVEAILKNSKVQV